MDPRLAARCDAARRAARHGTAHTPHSADHQKQPAVAQAAAIVQIDPKEWKVTGVVCTPDVPVVSNCGGELIAHIYTKAAIRQAAHALLLDNGLNRIDIEHESLERTPTGDIIHPPSGEHAAVIESYIAPQDLVIGTTAIPEGSWVMTSFIKSTRARQALLRGELTAYSLTTNDYTARDIPAAA